MVCKGNCLRQEYISEYNIIKSVSQKYRRKKGTGFRLPDGWHWCRNCVKYYQGPDLCPCCHLKTRTVARQKRTTETQKEYYKRMPEHAIDQNLGPHGIRWDILKNLEKLNTILAS